MRRFAPSHCPVPPAPGMTTLPTEREGALRQTRCSWALVILLSVATVTVALSTSVASSHGVETGLTAK